jgi:hypothetical protein
MRIEGSESLFRRIIKATSLSDVLDCTAEIRYALVFAGFRFIVAFVPPRSGAMPDLLVSRNDESAYVEITRIRQPPGPELIRAATAFEPHTEDDDLLADFDLLQSYGGEEDKVKIEGTLRGKFRQVRAVDGSSSIIATWSDRDFVEEIDFEQAMRNIRRSPIDPDDGRPNPERLLFCVFARFWINCGTGQQLYCEPLRELTEPFLTWMEELQQARLVELLSLSEQSEPR